MGYIGTKPTAAPLSSSQLEDGLVTAAKLATDAVETAKVKDINITTAKITDLNVTAGKLAATQDLSTKTITLPATVAGLGTGIDAATQLANKVPAANLGTGTASATTYLAGDQSYKALSEYDDDAVQNDIATLALHQATNANAAKYNLTNTNVDVFQDSTGVASFTDCARNSSGEFVASVYTTVDAFTSDANTMLLLHFDGVNDATTTTDSSSKSHTITLNSNTHLDTGVKKFGTASAQLAGGTDNVQVDASSDFAFAGDFTHEGWYYLTDLTAQYETYLWHSTGVDVAGEIYWNKYYHSASGSAYPQIELFNNSTTQSWTGNNSTTTGGLVTFNAWQHLALVRDGSVGRSYLNGVQISTMTGGATTLTGTYGSATPNLYIGGDSAGHPSAIPITGYIDEWRTSDSCRYPDGTTFTPNEVSADNATGNFVSTATTANASVSKVGIVITYKNQTGTNALNTDIVAQVSADGGSNYSTCVLAAAGTFSTGVLQAVANDVSVTAGTSIQYKISFANQSSASKEARITGVSLIY